LGYAHCFGIAAFAFHLEQAFERTGDAAVRAYEPGLRGWLDLEADSVSIDPVWGALRIVDPIPPLHEIFVTDEGEVTARHEKSTSAGSRNATEIFDELRPYSRSMIAGVLERSIILDALQVRGRRYDPLADKAEVASGCFLAGLKWQREKAAFILENAYLYDVELRVNPKLRPRDISSRETLDQIPHAPRKPKSGAATEALKALWPNGIPAGLTAKDRYRQIEQHLRLQGLSIPSERTVRRAISDE